MVYRSRVGPRSFAHPAASDAVKGLSSRVRCSFGQRSTPESPVPRWSSTTSLWCTSAGAIACSTNGATATAPWPGPPLSEMRILPLRTVRSSRATLSPIVPGVLPVRSSGTRIVAHWNPSWSAHARQRSLAPAVAGSARRAATSASSATACLESRTGGAGIEADPTAWTQVWSTVGRQVFYAVSLERPVVPQYAEQKVEGSSMIGRGMRPEQAALAREWKRLSRAATVVAVLTAPAFLLVLVNQSDWPLFWALIGTFFAVIAFRGLIDIIAHRMIPRPSLYGADREELLDDATARRRVWYWRGKFKLALWIFGLLLGTLLLLSILLGKSMSGTLSTIGDAIPVVAPQMLILGLQLPLLFLINFGILFGPLLVFGLKQMKGYEPGDADWGVKLEDVRGQTEPKQDVTRVIELWQSGEEFRKAGGKPERGLLFIGAPGTGKTMLSKAIATSFNSPIVTMPGSGFAQ